MSKLQATGGSVEIDDGVYAATLLSITDREATPNSPNQDMWRLWIFEVYDTEESKEMTAASSMAFGPKAKARRWIEGLLGRKLESGEEIDTETICPLDCQVVIKNDPDTGFARIHDVMGMRRRQAGKKPVMAGEGVEV